MKKKQNFQKSKKIKICCDDLFVDFDRCRRHKARRWFLEQPQDFLSTTSIKIDEKSAPASSKIDFQDEPGNASKMSLGISFRLSQMYRGSTELART